MGFKPILFSTPMVEAILDGQKTQTRRVIKPQTPEAITKVMYLDLGIEDEKYKSELIRVDSKYRVGDILWVRETWAKDPQNHGKYRYKEDWDDIGIYWKWKPSIHMPFDATRIFLKIKNIKIEKLQDISEKDAISEGIKPVSKSNQQLIEQGQLYQSYCLEEKFQDGLPPFWSFNSLWCKINGGESWEANPWVWVYEFEVLKTETGKCISCGCTDNNCKQCIIKTGNPCYWVNSNHTVCSACKASKS